MVIPFGTDYCFCGIFCMAAKPFPIDNAIRPGTHHNSSSSTVPVRYRFLSAARVNRSIASRHFCSFGASTRMRISERSPGRSIKRARCPREVSICFATLKRSGSCIIASASHTGTLQTLCTRVVLSVSRPSRCLFRKIISMVDVPLSVSLQKPGTTLILPVLSGNRVPSCPSRILRTADALSDS